MSEYKFNEIKDFANNNNRYSLVSFHVNTKLTGGKMDYEFKENLFFNLFGCGVWNPQELVKDYMAGFEQPPGEYSITGLFAFDEGSRDNCGNVEITPCWECLHSEIESVVNIPF